MDSITTTIFTNDYHISSISTYLELTNSKNFTSDYHIKKILLKIIVLILTFDFPKSSLVISMPNQCPCANLRILNVSLSNTSFFMVSSEISDTP